MLDVVTDEAKVVELLVCEDCRWSLLLWSVKLDYHESDFQSSQGSFLVPCCFLPFDQDFLRDLAVLCLFCTIKELCSQFLVHGPKDNGNFVRMEKSCF